MNIQNYCDIILRQETSQGTLAIIGFPSITPWFVKARL